MDASYAAGIANNAALQANVLPQAPLQDQLSLGQKIVRVSQDWRALTALWAAVSAYVIRYKKLSFLIHPLSPLASPLRAVCVAVIVVALSVLVKNTYKLYILFRKDKPIDLMTAVEKGNLSDVRWILNEWQEVPALDEDFLGYIDSKFGALRSAYEQAIKTNNEQIALAIAGKLIPLLNMQSINQKRWISLRLQEAAKRNSFGLTKAFLPFWPNSVSLSISFENAVENATDQDHRILGLFLNSLDPNNFRPLESIELNSAFWSCLRQYRPKEEVALLILEKLGFQNLRTLMYLENCNCSQGFYNKFFSHPLTPQLAENAFHYVSGARGRRDIPTNQELHRRCLEKVKSDPVYDQILGAGTTQFWTQEKLEALRQFRQSQPQALSTDPKDPSP